MSAPSVAPTTTGTITYAWYNGRRAGRLNERVSITANAASMTLNKQLPARCRVLMTALKCVTAVGLAHSGNSGTSVLCDSFALCKSLPTTNATSNTVANVIVAASATGATSTNTSGASRSISAGTADTSVTYSVPEQYSRFTTGSAGTAVIGSTGAFFNTATNALTLYLLPVDIDGTENFNQNPGGVATNGYVFGATGTVDVDLWFEEFVTNPTA